MEVFAHFLCMRRPRLKLDASKEEAYYHCISRTAGGDWLLGDREKEVLRKQLWELAEYCGLEVVTYALMSNHYHILLKVPIRRELSDEELLRRYRSLYSKRKPSQERQLLAVERDMKVNGELAQRWRQRLRRQMFDISEFNKLLKQRFTVWFNATHGRYGTLWSERFKSLLVERGEALLKVAAYVDGNATRAGIVTDPKDYRFCGYAEAVAGNKNARDGLSDAMGIRWADGSERYRSWVIMHLSEAREGKVQAAPHLVNEVLKTGGKLPIHAVLQCRIRYFTDGVILGSRDYVARRSAGLLGRPAYEPQPLAPVTDWGDLHVLSRMRSNLWG